MKYIFLVSAILFFALSGKSQNINEGFNNVFSLYSSGNWFTINNSNPSNSNIWYQDFGNFTANSGPANSSITAGWYCTDTVGVGNTSVWLFTPPVVLNNGDSISFYTISYSNNYYPDRMELRLNTTSTDTSVGTTETSVGNYTTLLLTINPLLDTINYPLVWTKYSVVLSGMSGNPGRIAFRYLVPNTGGSGTNGSVVGIDDFSFKSILTGINQHDVEKDISIFPNPVVDLLTISLQENINANYFIYDVSGKLTLNGTLSGNQTQLNVQTLEKGIYKIKFASFNGTNISTFVKW